MEFLQLATGLGIAAVSMVGGIIFRDRQVIRMINVGDEKLHKRITEFEHDYVRREHLREHIQAIQNTVNQMREEQRETNRRIDTVLNALSKAE